MASFNRVIMMGNLTRDPEYKQLSSGQPLCRLGLASNRQFKNRQNGETIQEVCFIDVDVWGPQAESCSNYLQKGRTVLVEGRLKLDSWQDNDGNKRTKHSIVADRVVFMPAGQNAEAMDEGDQANFGSAEGPTTPATAEPQASRRKAPRPASSAPGSGKPAFGGEVAFKDQEPFKDDLPF